MKEKILEIYRRKFVRNVPTNTMTSDPIEDFISQALDEYADWKIKECLPEEPEIETSPTCCKGAFSAGFVRCKNMMLIKAGIKKDLSNKDKK